MTVRMLSAAPASRIAARALGCYATCMERTFPVILVPQSEGGFFVECPSLPGCYSQGETTQEALDNIREAILLTLDDLRALGQPVPEPETPLITSVRVAG